jgi:hypothetical protein
VARVQEAVGDEEALRALDQIEEEIGPERMERGVARELNLDELCEKYQKIKPWLSRALGLIEKIPVYGSKIALAIRFLMGIADVACPVA